MTPHDIRSLLRSDDTAFPCQIETRGGKSYVIETRSSAFIFGPYPNTLVIARPGKGLACVGLDAIDAIRPHDASAHGTR
jgi:hypothetical protein